MLRLLGSYSLRMMLIMPVLAFIACSSDDSSAKKLPMDGEIGIATQKRTAEQLYLTSCISCHQYGSANAPRAFDVQAWQLRLEKTMPVLLHNIKQGINAMPPYGMCKDCSDDEFEALVRYMASPKPQK